MMRSVLALVLLSLAALSAQQPRDNRPRVAAGTSGIHGIVQAGGPDRVPLRRVKVTVSSAEVEFARTVLTGEDGTYAFQGLPAGRYVVLVSKEGYVTASAGARRLGRLGNIELRAGSAARVDLTMVKGAVITGRVQMPNGEAAPGVSMMVFTAEHDPLGGPRLLPVPGGAPSPTDDRGEYRIFGLPPGTYYVRAQPRFQMVPGAEDGLHIPTDVEIRAALAEVRTEATSSRPGIPARPRPAPVAHADPRRGVTLAPIYFPSTSIPSRAAAITLKAAEVRTGVDIDLEYVPLATVEGYVSVPPGASRVVVTLSSVERVSGAFSRTTSAGQDGAFMVRGVPPGTYAITARVLQATSTGPSPGYWGSTEIAVSGEDLAGVSVAMHPGITIAGRVVFEATSGLPSQLGGIPVPQLQAANVTFATNAFLPPVRFDGQSFRIDHVIPGTYRFLSPARGIRAPIGRWWLKSIVVEGKEMLDRELELKENTDQAVVTFSDRASELTGSVQYASGLPVRDEMVIVFSADPQHWFHASRWIAAVRPSAAGRYVVRNLPAGDYFIAVTAELLANEWYVAEELKGLTPEAVRIRIGSDESTTFDVRLNR